MEKQKPEIIAFIVKNNPRLKKEGLKKLSIPALVIIKVQIEIELQWNKNPSL